MENIIEILDLSIIKRPYDLATLEFFSFFFFKQTCRPMYSLWKTKTEVKNYLTARCFWFPYCFHTQLYIVMLLPYGQHYHITIVNI